MRASPLCMRHHQHRYLRYYSDLCSTGAIRLQWHSYFVQLFNKFRSIVRASDAFPRYFHFPDNRDSTHTYIKWNSKLYNGVSITFQEVICKKLDSFDFLNISNMIYNIGSYNIISCIIILYYIIYVNIIKIFKTPHFNCPIFFLTIFFFSDFSQASASVFNKFYFIFDYL